MAEREAKPEGQETVFKPEQAEAAIGILADFYTDLFEIADSSERATTATMTYVDRMILLAGGTLTLIFTVVGSISSHLAASHQSAAHPSLIIISCWLLVLSILSGLICSGTLIKKQHQAGTGTAITKAETRMRMRVLARIATTKPDEIEKLPRFPRGDLEKEQKVTARWGDGVRCNSAGLAVRGISLSDTVHTSEHQHSAERGEVRWIGLRRLDGPLRPSWLSGFGFVGEVGEEGFHLSRRCLSIAAKPSAALRSSQVELLPKLAVLKR